MNAARFNQIVKARIDKILNVLFTKNDSYATKGERLYNFKAGADIAASSPQETLWGYLTKHLLSVRDAVKGVRPFDEEFIDEKIGDCLNYFILLEALLLEKLETDNANKPRCGDKREAGRGLGGGEKKSVLLVRSSDNGTLPGSVASDGRGRGGSQRAARSKKS